MLKFVFLGLLMLNLTKSWLLTQISFLLSALLWGLLMFNSFNMVGMSMGLGVDSVSFILILLSFWLGSLVITGSQKLKEVNNFYMTFLLMVSLLILSLVLTFSCSDYLLFYICFESSLIPTLILILGWGYQPERLQAGVYMLFYTLFASLPLLVSTL